MKRKETKRAKEKKGEKKGTKKTIYSIVSIPNQIATQMRKKKDLPVFSCFCFFESGY
jgi:hypothetical protein